MVQLIKARWQVPLEILVLLVFIQQKISVPWVMQGQLYVSPVRIMKSFVSLEIMVLKKNHNGIIGFNSRLDEIQAAFLRVKLPHLNRINQHKQKLASIYLENPHESYIKPVVAEGFGNVYHIFNIRHPERDRIKAYLQNEGIGTEIHYPVAPHKQKALKTMNNFSFQSLLKFTRLH